MSEILGSRLATVEAVMMYDGDSDVTTYLFGSSSVAHSARYASPSLRINLALSALTA
jgi:hypothetical protein